MGGKTYTTIDGSIRESLTVTYYFEKKKWEYVYHTAKRNYIVVTALLELKNYIIALISYYQSVKRTLYSSLGIYDRIVNSDNHVNVIEYDYLGSAKESVIRLF